MRGQVDRARPASVLQPEAAKLVSIARYGNVGLTARQDDEYFVRFGFAIDDDALSKRVNPQRHQLGKACLGAIDVDWSKTWSRAR